MAVVYSTMGFISLQKEMFNISAFCFVVVGSILSFLWFNITPAKFFMSEVGYTALSFGLPVIALITDTIIFLPIIAFILYINLLVTIIQKCAILCLRRRIFKVAPLHHHLEFIGWTKNQIVVRYLIISIIMSILSIMLISIAN